MNAGHTRCLNTALMSSHRDAVWAPLGHGPLEEDRKGYGGVTEGAVGEQGDLAEGQAGEGSHPARRPNLERQIERLRQGMEPEEQVTEEGDECQDLAEGNHGIFSEDECVREATKYVT